MKKLILYSFMSLFLISSCRESDNANVPEFIEVPMPSVTKVSGDPTISIQNPDGFNAKFKVGLFFPDGDKPTKMDVVVRKNTNNSVIKVIQNDVTTFPTELPVTGVQLRTLFGAPIALGDRFDIGVDITLANGKKYLAFPTVGVPYGTGVASPAGSSVTTLYEAVCTFKMSDYGAIGSTVDYTVLVDGWQDFAKGQTIPVKIIDETHMSFEYPADGAKPIVITINPVNNTTSVADIAYGSYAGDNYAASSAPNNILNSVSPCQLTVSVVLIHRVLPNGGSSSPLQISLKKK